VPPGPVLKEGPRQLRQALAVVGAKVAQRLHLCSHKPSASGGRQLLQEQRGLFSKGGTEGLERFSIGILVCLLLGGAGCVISYWRHRQGLKHSSSRDILGKMGSLDPIVRPSS
jgi:hypothetical protein